MFLLLRKGILNIYSASFQLLSKFAAFISTDEEVLP